MGYKQQIKKKKKKFINQFKISKFFKKKNHQSNFFNSLKEFKTSKFFKKKKKKSSIKFFQFLEKIQDFQIFQKKKKKIINQIFFQFLEKFQDFQIFQKKKKEKKESSLNSFSETESYDPLPHSPVMQRQVNYPPSAFIEAWSMSQTRGIRQVCQSLFNE